MVQSAALVPPLTVFQKATTLYTAPVQASVALSAAALVVMPVAAELARLLAGRRVVKLVVAGAQAVPHWLEA